MSAENTMDFPSFFSTSSAYQNHSNSVSDAQAMFTQCSKCHYFADRLTTEVKFLSISSCGHVLCNLCLTMASFCPICDTQESFMDLPTIHNNIAYCTLHKEKQAEVYCRECMRFLCSEKECEEHSVVKIEDIVLENTGLGDDIDSFQSSLRELTEMELGAKNSLSELNITSLKMRKMFQSIINAANERLAEIETTIQSERSMLTKKVDNISKNVAAVNRRIQTASKLCQITRKHFAISNSLIGETYKLAAGNILQNTLKISDDVKITAQQLKNYKLTFKKDDRMHVIVRNMKTLFPEYTVSDGVTSKDCEVPSQMCSTDTVVSSRSPWPTPPVSLRRITLNSKKPINYQPVSEGMSSKDREILTHTNSSDQYTVSDGVTSKDCEVPSQMSSTDKVVSSKRPWPTPPISLRRITLSSKKPINYQPVSEGMSSKDREILTHTNSSDQVPSSNNSDPPPESISSNSDSPNKQSASSTLSPQKVHSHNEVKLENAERKSIPPRRRKAPKETQEPEKRMKTMDWSTSSKSREIPSRIPPSSEHSYTTKKDSDSSKSPNEMIKYRSLKPVDYPKLKEVFMNEMCKQEPFTLLTQESRNLVEEEVEKMCGEAGTEHVTNQINHINRLVLYLHRKENHEELLDVKPEIVKIEPPDVLDKEIKQEQFV